MSFRQALTATSISSDALSLISQAPLVSFDTDVGLAARECRRHYPRVVGMLLEKYHFGVTTRTTSLTSSDEIGTLRWMYKHTLPQEVAHVVRLAYPESAANSSYYTGLAAVIESANQNFAVEGRTLWANILNPTIDFVSYNITEDDFTELLAEAIRLHLAAAIAMPITKRKDLRDDYEAKAEAHLNATLARERNKQSPRYGDGPSEADYARSGGYDLGWGAPRW